MVPIESPAEARAAFYEEILEKEGPEGLAAWFGAKLLLIAVAPLVAIVALENRGPTDTESDLFSWMNVQTMLKDAIIATNRLTTSVHAAHEPMLSETLSVLSRFEDHVEAKIQGYSPEHRERARLRVDAFLAVVRAKKSTSRSQHPSETTAPSLSDIMDRVTRSILQSRSAPLEKIRAAAPDADTAKHFDLWQIRIAAAISGYSTS